MVRGLTERQRSNSGATAERYWCDSGAMMSQVDWGRQQRFDLPFLICCLVLILFSSVFFRSLNEILSVLQSRKKYFVTNCTLTFRMYPLRTREFKTTISNNQ